jgi:predicted RNase H-like HicB family nuclease
MFERIECEREVDGHWIAEIVEIFGAMAYGISRDDAVTRAIEVARQVIAERSISSDSTPSN